VQYRTPDDIGDRIGSTETYLTISEQRACTALELGLVTKRTVCGGDSHFSKICKHSIC
jgi:hypothetical protein